jgi:signal transduction histidine kinase
MTTNEPNQYRTAKAMTAQSPTEESAAPRSAGANDPDPQSSCREKYQAVVDENAALRQALQKLEETKDQLVKNEKMASIGRLAAGIAHEINNPVGYVSSNCTTLSGYTNRIMEVVKMYEADIPRTMIERHKKKIKFDFIVKDIDKLIMGNIEGLARITDIVNNLKKFARNEQAKEFSENDINDGIRSVLVIAKNEIKCYADVTTDYGEIGTIPCNINEINQVILNMVINAAQAIREQKRETKGAITISTKKDDAWVYCAIQDDGPGIPEEIRQKIFDPFFTTKEVGIGTGLGLSISHEIIVNKHKGEIRVESEKGKGTSFIIKLPRTRREKAGAEQAPVR